MGILIEFFLCCVIIRRFYCLLYFAEMDFRNWTRLRTPIDNLSSWRNSLGKWGSVRGIPVYCVIHPLWSVGHFLDLEAETLIFYILLNALLFFHCRLIKEFDRELKDEETRNSQEVNKQLNEKKQSMVVILPFLLMFVNFISFVFKQFWIVLLQIKELNTYVALRKTWVWY